MRENKKTAKNGFPLRGKVKKCWKSFVARERNAENAKNCPSLVSEMQKMRKTAFRLQATSEKRWKRPVARERNAENAKNSISLTSDERKTEKVGLRGIPKGWNSEKQCFGMPRRVVFGENEPSGESRSLKISRNKLSGSPEARKIWKTGPRGAPKRPNMIFPSAKWWLKAENAGCWLNMIALHITKTPLQLLS